MIKSVCIQPNGTTAHLSLPDKTAFSEISDHVGGYVEGIILPSVTIWCNEDGQVLEMPYNPLATAFWRYADPTSVGHLVGTVVVTGTMNGDKITALSAEHQQMLPALVIA